MDNMCRLKRCLTALLQEIHFYQPLLCWLKKNRIKKEICELWVYRVHNTVFISRPDVCGKYKKQVDNTFKCQSQNAVKNA